MADEGMDISKVLVRVLILLALIAAIFGLYQLISGKLSSGTNKLSDNLNSMDSSTYAAYDDAIVTGTEVLTALKSFRDADFAVCVVTKAQDIGIDDAPGVKYQNYCALLTTGDDDSKTNPSATSGGTAMVVSLETDSKNGGFTADDLALAWDSSTGHSKRNTNFSLTQQQSDTKTFVQQKAKFKGHLIHDANDAAIGVVFIQYGGAE